jgi:hypothetical protein
MMRVLNMTDEDKKAMWGVDHGAAPEENARHGALYGLIIGLAFQAGDASGWPIGVTLTMMAGVLLLTGYLLTGNLPRGRDYLSMVGMVAVGILMDTWRPF